MPYVDRSISRISVDKNTGLPLWDNGPWPSSNVASSIDWNNVFNKPTVFPPATHIHNESHLHANKIALDKITENAGKPLWNGAEWPSTGDMLKSVYDTNNDGIVDKAFTLHNLIATITELNSLQSITGNVQQQLNNKQNSSQKGQINGYASLDNTGKVPLSQLPDLSSDTTYVVSNSTQRNALTGLKTGDKCYETTTGDSYIWNDSGWLVLAQADWKNINLDWTNIKGKPTSTVANIDDAVTKAHQHSNKIAIDKITESGSLPLWNGSPWPAASVSSVPWANITGKPTIFPTNWSNVASKPTSFPSTWTDVTNKPSVFPTDWSSVASKPTTFPPSTHTHLSTWSISLPSTSWTGTGPFVLTATCTGLLTTDRPIVDIDLSSVAFNTVETILDAASNLYRVESLAGQIKFYAIQKPTQNLIMSVLVVR